MIFYFSATGNSKYLAEKIAEKTAEKTVSITDCILNEQYAFTLPSGERLGFVFPVYFSGVPRAVLDFTKKMSIISDGKSFVYTALTCGGSTAQAQDMFRNALLKKGIKINAYFGAVLPDNYIPMFAIPDMETAKDIIKNAQGEIEKICSLIEKKESGDFNNAKGAKLLTYLMYPFYKPFSTTKPFFADENCIACGKCARECVSRAIEMQNGKPVWIKPKCTSCMHCIHSCPEKAIQYGKKSKKKNRYMNPYI